MPPPTTAGTAASDTETPGINHWQWVVTVEPCSMAGYQLDHSLTKY